MYKAFNTLLCPRYLLKCGENNEHEQTVDIFMQTMLSLIRCDAEDDRPICGQMIALNSDINLRYGQYLRVIELRRFRKQKM